MRLSLCWIALTQNTDMRTYLIVLLAICFVACSSSETAADPTNTSDPVDNNGDNSGGGDTDGGEDVVDFPTDAATGNLELTLQHDGGTREYILYVPNNYDSTQEYPLVLALHGLGSNNTQHRAYTGWRSIADNNNLIIAYPQGLPNSSGQNHWNVLGWDTTSTSDDVGFIDTLITEIGLTYNLELDRVYSTGMSNGGFMSFRLACELPNRIAAIGSVTGTMTPQVLASCNPSQATTVVQIQGTADPLVSYNGTPVTTSVAAVTTFWTDFNNTDVTPDETALPNVSTTDGSDIDEFVYDNGDNDTQYVHLRVNGGGHSWPGAWDNQDIIAAEYIWDVIGQYDINGRIN